MALMSKQAKKIRSPKKGEPPVAPPKAKTSAKRLSAAAHLPKIPKGKTLNPAGRPKGTKNKMTTTKIKIMQETGMTPIDFLTAVFRDQLCDEYVMRHIPATDNHGEVTFFEPAPKAKKIPVKLEQRIAAANYAAPYYHSKKPTGIVINNGKPVATITADQLKTLSNEEIDRMLEVADKLGIGTKFEGAEDYRQMLGTEGSDEA